MSLLSPIPDEKLLGLDGFLASLESEINRADESNVVAVLVIALQRSDRLSALLSHDYAAASQAAFLERVFPVLRSKDRLAFVNENECWLLLPQLSSDALAVLATHRVLTALGTPLKIATHTIFFTPTIGIACAPTHTNNLTALLRLAESAQKNASANRLDFVLAAQDAHLADTPADLPAAIEDVLDTNRLEMRFQPKVDLRTRSVVSVEALVRWPADHAQMVPTQLLIDVAERCGMIELLTMRVFNMVMQEMQGWRKSDMTMLVWINLSAKLLALEHLPAMLSRAMQIWDIPAASVGLEITESALINDIEHTTNVLFELRDLGFHLSIDDFGTGYSSLAYLRRFPIDELKIDRMFIQGMTESLQDRQIVQSIIDLGHNFGLQVIAEGVEEASTLTQLELLGCDQIQGYLFARPMPGDALIHWCKAFQRSSDSAAQ